MAMAMYRIMLKSISLNLLVLLISTGIIYSAGNPTSQRKQSTRNANLRSRIDRLIADTQQAGAEIGIKIIELKGGRVLYEKNAQKLFHPASVQKLLTTACALDILGSKYRFPLTASVTSPPEGGIVHGDMVVKGTGDPLLKVADFDSVIARLDLAGIRRIEGDLVGDASFFDTIPWGQGWMWDDEPNSDEAFITPLTVEGNCITVTVSPGPTAGSGAVVSFSPITDYVTLQNQCITTSMVEEAPPAVHRSHGLNTVLVDGTIGRHSEPVEVTISVAEPALYFIHLFIGELQSHGITLTGHGRVGTSRGEREIARTGHLLDSVVHFTNKTSYNLGAETILKTLGAHKFGPPGSAENGIRVIKEYLAENHIDTSKMRLVDGSGVSWYNLLSPDGMVGLLAHEYHNTKNFPVFYESLPVAGVDGTLKNRLGGTQAAGNVHAKTGTLLGVSTLAGYVRTADKHLLAFCIMTDHYPDRIVASRNLQDTVMKMLAGYRLQN